MHKVEHVENTEHFNSHPHEEDDYGTCNVRAIYIISTHILTRRMTMKTVEKRQEAKFQLTSSRGG